MFISHDVVFHESIFPFKTNQASSSLLDIFPNIVSPFPHSSSTPKSTSLPMSTSPTIFMLLASHSHLKHVRNTYDDIYKEIL